MIRLPFYLLTGFLVDPNSIVVEVLPVDVNKLNHNTSVDDGSITVLRLAIPSQDTPSFPDNAQPLDQDETRQSWISAFQRCFRFTLCSISIPSRNHDTHLDLAFDTHQTVFSLLASGLPLPKSPSVQFANLQNSKTDDPTMQEREERGWWSVRFRQVFRELQRQDVALATAGF